MQDLATLFAKQQEISREAASIRREYKDQLRSDADYERVCEKIADLKIKKEQLETEAKNALGSRWNRAEEIKNEIASLREMMSDIVVNSLATGTPVKLKDANDIEYEPVYRVSFKKVR